MKTKLYNLQAKASGEIELSDKVFGVDVKPELVHEVWVSQTSNQRQPWAHTKTRGEVRGGGRKPWAQKGTGRARHGSIRSPLWKGGGVTFGPLSKRNYQKKINKKTRKLALKMCLSDRFQNKGLIVMENFAFKEPKTKILVSLLESLPAEKKKFLLVTAAKDDNVLRMAKNLKTVDVVRAEDINIMDILNKENMAISKEAVELLTKMLVK